MARNAKEAESAVVNMAAKIEEEEGEAPSFDDLGPELHTIQTNSASRPWDTATFAIGIAGALLVIYRVLSV